MTDQDLQARVADIRAKAARVQERVAQVRGRANELDGHVGAEVDAAGNVLRLSLDGLATSERPNELASLITKAIARARQDAERQAKQIAVEMEGDPLFGRAMSDLRAGMATPPSEQPAAPEVDDEEWNDASYWLRRG
jgi:DNA-binding protein YbaB